MRPEPVCYICQNTYRDCVGHTGLPVYLQPFRDFHRESRERVNKNISNAVREGSRRHRESREPK